VQPNDGIENRKLKIGDQMGGCSAAGLFRLHHHSARPGESTLTRQAADLHFVDEVLLGEDPIFEGERLIVIELIAMEREGVLANHFSADSRSEWFGLVDAMRALLFVQFFFHNEFSFNQLTGRRALFNRGIRAQLQIAAGGCST
jgi:hypothetical protein